MNPTSTAAWRALTAQSESIRTTHLREVFAQDPSRAQRMAVKACGIYLDYSKNRVSDEVLNQLVKLAEETGVPAHARKMFAGEKINNTEKRAVLHTALRNLGDSPVVVDGQNVIPAVREVRSRTNAFARRVRNGEWLGFSGQTITDVVNIGIGGSDLGPLMVVEALKPLADGPRLHFVSNVDSLHLNQTLKGLDPARTLFIVASKTFTTIETLTNARSARTWLLEAAQGDKSAIARHFVAVSTNKEKVSEFGIDLDNMFGFWDWVGGRYSLWSSIGLPIAVALGPDGFDMLLAGAYEMDQHFQNAPIRENLPYLLALLGVWYNNFLDAKSHVVAPYNQTLHRLPAFLQQLDMESNGKSVRADGEAVSYATGPVIWGEPGTNGQHAFFQLLHQGTSLIPVDFILALNQPGQIEPHRTSQIANCLAQSSALMQGKTQAEVQAEMREKGVPEAQIAELLTHREFSGNRPSNMMLLDDLSPRSLGALIALYEHKVFVQGVIWGLNSFDQWGVELGKQLATGIEQRLGTPSSAPGYDASTEALIAYVKAAKR
jgi:glucose-6-phosphate isomerase